MNDNIMPCQWHYPTNIVLQVGGLKGLKGVLSDLNIKRPLWVVDDFLLKFSLISRAIEQIQELGVLGSVFSQFESNPSGENVAAGTLVFNENRCDGVVVIGGGSALDVGKVIALVAQQQRSVWDFVDEGENYLRADSGKIAPIIAVPTTAGTGSEVGRAALITDSTTHEKKIIFHPKMLPSSVILDPELSVSLPPALTAATGMDALTHSIEAYCAPGFHPMADGIALEGARLVKTNLIEAFENGTNLQARSAMLSASLMGATAFQKGLGAVHALAHPIGGLYNVHHGLLNAILLPYVLQINRMAIEEKCVRLARYLNLPEFNFEAVLAWVLKLNTQLKLPLSLAALNIDDAKADTIAQRAMQDPSAASNPVALTEGQYKNLFCNAVAGNWSGVKSAVLSSS